MSRQLSKAGKSFFIDRSVLLDDGKERRFVKNNQIDIRRASGSRQYGLGCGVARREGQETASDKGSGRQYLFQVDVLRLSEMQLFHLVEGFAHLTVYSVDCL